LGAPLGGAGNFGHSALDSLEVLPMMPLNFGSANGMTVLSNPPGLFTGGLV